MSSDEECAFCLEEMQNVPRELITFTCNHKFHKKCVLGYIASLQASSFECPLCREPVQCRVVYTDLRLLVVKTFAKCFCTLMLFVGGAILVYAFLAKKPEE
jgi:hypothetical protein